MAKILFPCGRTGGGMENFLGFFGFLRYLCRVKAPEHNLHKEKIVAQAMQIFLKQGIKAVRMDDIAQMMGISKRTLYELFGDKETLLFLAVESYFGECNERRARLSAGARDVLEAIFLELNELMAQSETANRIMSSLRKFHPAVHDRVLHEGAEKNRRNIREMLEKGIADGFFVADFNLDLAITMLYHTALVLVEPGFRISSRSGMRNASFLAGSPPGHGGADEDGVIFLLPGSPPGVEGDGHRGAQYHTGHLPAGQPIEGLAQQIAGGDGGDEKDVRVPRHRAAVALEAGRLSTGGQIQRDGALH